MRPKKKGYNNGENKLLREHLQAIKTGKCEKCGINLYGKKKEQMPATSTLPCPNENCIY